MLTFKEFVLGCLDTQSVDIDEETITDDQPFTLSVDGIEYTVSRVAYEDGRLEIITADTL